MQTPELFKKLPGSGAIHPYRIWAVASHGESARSQHHEIWNADFRQKKTIKHHKYLTQNSTTIKNTHPNSRKSTNEDDKTGSLGNMSNMPNAKEYP